MHSDQFFAIALLLVVSETVCKWDCTLVVSVLSSHFITYLHWNVKEKKTCISVGCLIQFWKMLLPPCDL
uniref:Secreted protein n=1 Tax=Arundo donax TaxID=35708 RepID=A0A0A8Y776_ARUDO